MTRLGGWPFPWPAGPRGMRRLQLREASSRSARRGHGGAKLLLLLASGTAAPLAAQVPPQPTREQVQPPRPAEENRRPPQLTTEGGVEQSPCPLADPSF